MTRKQSELTAGEWAIIQAVWDNEPCAAPTIQEALEKKIGWSYSTVKTMMDRMVEKGLLTTERIRNLLLYRSAITRKEAQKMGEAEVNMAGSPARSRPSCFYALPWRPGLRNSRRVV